MPDIQIGGNNCVDFVSYLHNSLCPFDRYRLRSNGILCFFLQYLSSSLAHFLNLINFLKNVEGRKTKKNKEIRPNNADK